MGDAWTILMAGGVGSRFWPVSRAHRPKQLLDLFGDGSMLKVTVDRVRSRVPIERQVVVTGTVLVDTIQRELPGLPAKNLLAEPVGRNTAAAIGWGALTIQRRDPDAVLMVLPADQHIADPDAYRAVVDDALRVAAGGVIVTLGIPPTRPETGYGYITRSERRADGAYGVAAFREKPDVETALAYLRAGDTYWNAGMFFAPVGLMLDELRRYEPQLMAQLDAMAPGDEANAYPQMKSISIDYAVMERTPNIAVIPGSFGWSDVGSWESLFDHRGAGAGSYHHGDVIELDGSGNVLFADGDATVATVGVSDLVVVHTRDAAFVCPRTEAQRARDVVAALKAAGKQELL